jgi:hypothetical protein
MQNTVLQEFVKKAEILTKAAIALDRMDYGYIGIGMSGAYLQVTEQVVAELVAEGGIITWECRQGRHADPYPYQAEVLWNGVTYLTVGRQQVFAAVGLMVPEEIRLLATFPIDEFEETE